MYLSQAEVQMKKLMRRCKHCGCLFEVCNKVKKHEYCNKKKCQRARKRKLHLKYTERNRKKQRKRNQIQRAESATKPISKPIAKMDALMLESNIISGRYELVPVKSDMIAKMDALIVEINTISGSYPHLGP
jgi:hypothetical protein